MNYPADSTAKLRQGGKGRYVGREGVPVDNCSRGKCEPVIVFESQDLSVGPMLKGVCVVMFWCFEQGSLMQG